MTSVMPQVANVATECQSKPWPKVSQATPYSKKTANAAGREVRTPRRVSQPRAFSITIQRERCHRALVPGPVQVDDYASGWLMEVPACLLCPVLAPRFAAHHPAMAAAAP